MSQMPDKIWLHKDTKYSTGDEVSGYQYKFLAEEEGIENFVEYVPSDALIEKAEKFLKAYRRETADGTGYIAGIVDDRMIEEFKNYMKGE